MTTEREVGVKAFDAALDTLCDSFYDTRIPRAASRAAVVALYREATENALTPEEATAVIRNYTNQAFQAGMKKLRCTAESK